MASRLESLFHCTNFIFKTKNTHLQLQGKCLIRSELSINEPLDTWKSKGEFRFYFNQTYNKAQRCFEELSEAAERYGRSKGKDGKGKGYNTSIPTVVISTSNHKLLIFRQEFWIWKCDHGEERESLWHVSGDYQTFAMPGCLCRMRWSFLGLASVWSGRHKVGYRVVWAGGQSFQGEFSFIIIVCY